MEPLDPDARLATLLAEAPFLTRLARALCGAGADADEAVQETWMVALSSPPRELSSARGWLAATLRGRIANRARSAARRSARERVAARAEISPGAEVDLERIELQEQLLGCLRDLPAGQRDVLVLRFYEECCTAEIARRLGLGESGVRMRLTRGLAGLRERLDRSSGGADSVGGRQRWMSALAPMVGPTTVGPDVLAGALVMKKWALGVGLLLGLVLAGVGFKNWPSGAEAAEAPARGPGLAELEEPLDAATETAEPSAEPGVGRAAVAAVEQVAIGPAHLDVSVLWSDGSPAADVRLGLIVQGEQVSRMEQLSARTDGLGRLSFRDLPGGRATLESDRGPQSVWVELVPGESAQATFTLVAGESVRGRVVNATGRGVSGAELWVRPARGQFNFAVPHGRADETGSFRLRDLAGSAEVAARAQGYTASLEVEVEDLERADEGELELELRLGPSGAGFGGTVVDPDGRAVAGALVMIDDSRSRMARGGQGGPGTAASPAQLRTDVKGAFELIGDALVGEVRVHVLAVGWPEWRREVQVARGQRFVLHVQLEPGVELSGRVLDAEGAPVAEAWVELAGRRIRNSLAYDVPPPRARSGADGQYRLRGLAPGAWVVRASVSDPASGQALVDVQIGRGANVLDLRMDPEPAIRGLVLGSDGQPAEGFEVHSVSQGHELQWETARTREDGTFVLANLLPGAHDLKVVHPDLWSDELATLGDIVPGGPPVLFELEAESRATAWLIGSLDPALFERHPGLSVLVQEQDADTSYYVGTEELDGSFDYGPLQPGTYGVRVEAAGRRLIVLPPVELVDGERHDLGRLPIELPGSVVLRFDVESDPTARLWLERPEGSREDLHWEADEVHSGDVPPGEYVLGGYWSGQPLPRLAVWVEAGQEHVLDLDLPETREVELLVEADMDFGDPLRMSVRDSEGQKVSGLQINALERETPGELGLSLVLAEGDYRLHLWDGPDVRIGQFTVGPGTAGEGPLVVQLSP